MGSPTLGGSVFVKNALQYDYCIKESIEEFQGKILITRRLIMAAAEQQEITWFSRELNMSMS